MKLVIVFCCIVLASGCSAQNDTKPATETTSTTLENGQKTVSNRKLAVTESASKTSEKSTK